MLWKADVAHAVFQAQLACQAQAEVVALAGDFLRRPVRHGGNKLGEPGLLGQFRQQGGQVDDDAVHAVGQLQVNVMNLGLSALLPGDLQNHFEILPVPVGYAPVTLG